MKTWKEINSEIFEKINMLTISIEEKKELCHKLIGYRYVDIYDLQYGKFVRWIKPNAKLSSGGIVVDIKEDTILCKVQSRFIQYTFHETISFQKIPIDEQLIISALDI